MENNVEVKPILKAKLLKSWSTLKPFLSVVVGGFAGYLYYHFVGCNSGQCAITSDPYMSVIWGGLFGLFITGSPCSRGRC